MKQTFLKTAWCLGVALALATTGYAQESKVKIEGKDYEMKYKEDGDEYKLEEKGKILRSTQQTEVAPVVRTTTLLREGQTTTIVKAGQMPEVKQEVKPEPVAKQRVAKKTYTAKKKSVATKNKNTVAKKKPAVKRAVAAKPKAKASTTSRVVKTTVATTPLTPIVVRDTVMITRVDTVFSIMERDVFTGHSQNTIPLSNDFREVKIKKEDDELTLKIEYEDGSETKKKFSTQEELNLYLESDMDRRKELLDE